MRLEQTDNYILSDNVGLYLTVALAICVVR